MFDLVGYLLISVLGSIFTALITSSKKHWPLWSFEKKTILPSSWSFWARKADSENTANDEVLQDIKNLAECHETAALLDDLIHKDGAGEWPPRSNHAHTTWPAALRPYREIYEEMAPLLPRANVSLDNEVNKARITDFRSRLRKLLHEEVKLDQVEQLLKAAEAGRWDVFPRETYNAFYCCIAWCRHAYRWATIPVVSLAQLETTLPLPPQLALPWRYLQRHFGLTSESGNNMSNLVLNFDPQGPGSTYTYTLKINTGLSDDRITTSEEAFARIFHDVERLALPIYHAVVHATTAFARGDAAACLAHTQRITARLRPLLSSYYDRVHDARIARDVWLSHVQGFYAWGLGLEGEGEGDGDGDEERVKFDGLSGNQVLLFQVLDAFLGIKPYLSEENQNRNVPHRQRMFCKAVETHSFRGRLAGDGLEGRIQGELGEIVKRLRLFRTAHRTRAKVYLSQPAPERLPMTAGKSLLKADMDQSLEFLDEFMVGRLAQTV
ncbi:hypothetical protein C8A00DRAFT_42494 [Chaetomidium leptoderma]|uniref:Indoleamine 2,3-dioxygenase n=1 Tax=Chaetomidium leptoderma TaxID=669021 RepID=A0AAN6VNF4_9PEZI|nr:hypothetical protein C8A00DRAFT_42494 [Chaetomidium leptoderma]